MKNLSLVLNVILIAAVAYLYVVEFSGDSKVEESSTGASPAFQDVAIAYINSDSLLANYDLMDEIESKLTEKQQKFEKEYQNRAQGLQQEINDFQRTAGNLTITQAKALEENLVKKQQNLQQYQQSLSQQLMQEEARLNNDLYDRVSEYLKEYGKKNNLQLVLTYSKGSGVLFANDSLDISKDVIKGLNEAYSNGAVEVEETKPVDESKTGEVKPD